MRETDSGKFLSKTVPHDCPHPTLRQMRKEGVTHAEWQCDCGQVWAYWDTWAGDMWSRERSA